MDSSSLISNTNYDKRFYGIYRGIVVDTDDPANKNRIKVTVPQVTGADITNWAWPAGIVNPDANYTYLNEYGSFSSTSTATIVQVGTSAYTVAPLVAADFSTTKVVLNSGQNAAESNIDGIFEVTTVLQLVCSSGSSDIDVSIWLQKGSLGTYTDIEGTRHDVTIKGAGHNVVDLHTEIVSLSAGDGVRAALVASGPNIRFENFAAGTNPTRPTGFSTNITLKSLGLSVPYYPSSGKGVWVMYEGGDPNFPVWMGVF